MGKVWSKKKPPAPLVVVATNTENKQPVKKDFDYKFKVLMIGDAGVGKSSYMLRFVDNEFQDKPVTTLGVDWKMKNVDVHGSIIQLQIWDTAGQERFRTITSSFYRGAFGVIVCFDISNYETFLGVRRWYQEIQRYAEEDVAILLIGTKSDRANERAVPREEAQETANQLGIRYFEISSKDSVNISPPFECIAETMKEKQDPDT